jgi:hypothetical protein
MKEAFKSMKLVISPKLFVLQDGAQTYHWNKKATLHIFTVYHKAQNGHQQEF